MKKHLFQKMSIAGGNVPAWLSGTLYRVGPGVIQSGDTMYEHLFDMPSVLHKISLKPGIQRFTYQNRIVSLTSEEQSNNIQNQMPFGSKVRRYVHTKLAQIKAQKRPFKDSPESPPKCRAFKKEQISLCC